MISVYLDRPDYFVIRLDGKDHTILSVLADAPETEIPTADVHTIIVNGWMEVEGGVLKLTEPHTTVYIPAGAVLNARIHVLANDCRVLGRGAIVDPAGDIYRYNAEEMEHALGGMLQMRGVDRTLVDGIHFLDSKAFNLQVIGIWEERWATDNVVRNVKILTTQMSSDGITFGIIRAILLRSIALSTAPTMRLFMKTTLITRILPSERLVMRFTRRPMCVAPRQRTSMCSALTRG